MTDSHHSPHRPLLAAARAGGSALATAFELAARVRGSKPIHPRGAVLDAEVRRRGARRRWGAAWLDEPGVDAGLVRLSRSVGLPSPVPDVLGLALRFRDGSGTHDLLLASAALGRVSRCVLQPRTDPRSATYTSVMPFRAPQGRVLLAAAPTAGAGGPDLHLDLLVSSLTGAWEQFGELRLRRGGTAEGLAAPDAPVDFDPVLNPLPGLVVPPAVAVVRGRAYAGARRGRR